MSQELVENEEHYMAWMHSLKYMDCVFICASNCTVSHQSFKLFALG
jgi:hypothetical protein